LLIYSSFLFAQNENGLLFKSNDVNKDLRTSLHLTSEEEFEFSNSFSMVFDLKLQDTSLKFGYIFRIIFENNQNFDLLLNVPTRDAAHLLFIAEKNNLCEVQIRNSHFRSNDWNRIKLTFNALKDECIFDLNGHIFKSKFKFPPKKMLDVCFGVNKKAPFVSCDVPPIILKNIYVNIDNKRKEHLWELNKHGQNVVYDNLNYKTATTTNPVWMIDRHISWGNKRELKFPSRIFAVFDEENTLYVVSENKVYSYNLANSELIEYPFQPQLPITKLSNQFVYDLNKQQIVYADFENSKPTVSRFNFVSRSWDVPIEHQRESEYQQHNNFYSPIDSSLYQIFGYGFYTYKSDIQLFLKDGRTASKTFAPNISPRYLSATGIIDSTLYIYGGIGNQTGKQEYGSQVFNDLYEVNLKTFQVTKRWEINPNEKNEVAARTLIIEKSGKKAYSLFFNPTRYSSYLLLNEIDLKQPNTRAFADTIPYYFQDTQSEAMLFFSKSAQKLYAVTIHKSESTDYILNTYEISYPILSVDEVIQSAHQKYLWWYFAAGFLLIVLILSFIIMRKRRKKLDSQPIDLSNILDSNTSEHYSLPVKEIKRPGIYLLGGFQVIDKDNHDKTGEFTPAMKLLLSLIILFTLKNGKGISNVKLKEILWYDKSDESARNNRGVNISKIRLILNSIGAIEVTNDNSYWIVNFNEDAYCDYNEALALLKTAQKNTDLSVENLMGLLQIISAGELLPDIQEDWMDNFKSDYSNLVIDALLSIKDYKNITDNAKLLILIADTILVLDTLNEDAIKLKCKSLIKLGRIKIAIDVFNSFCKEYKILLNEEFEFSFENFMKQ
jgi:two-component SAPR family response regulator